MSDIETIEPRKPRPFPIVLRQGEDALLTINEAADVLALSPGHVRNRLDEFFPDRIQYGRRTVRVRLSDVLKLIERRTTRVPTPDMASVIARLGDEPEGT